MLSSLSLFFFFFFNDTATTEIYTLSLHDALPICTLGNPLFSHPPCPEGQKLRVRKENAPLEGLSKLLAFSQILEQCGQCRNPASLNQHPHGQRAFGIGQRDLFRRHAQKAVVKARKRDQGWRLPGQALGPL